LALCSTSTLSSFAPDVSTLKSRSTVNRDTIVMALL
jgi:hypothetical protein